MIIMEHAVMKRDVVVAVLIGFLLGSVSAVSLIKLPELLKRKPSADVTQKTDSVSPTPVLPVNQIPKLNVLSPVDFSVMDSTTASISGETNPGALIVAETPSETVTSTAGVSGSFAVKLKLTEGANTIYLTSYDNSSQYKSMNLTLFYTEEKL